MVSFNQALAAKKLHASSLLQQEFISGIGVGYLDPDDETQGAAIVMYVTEQPTSSTAIPARLEAEVEGERVSVPSRIVVTGEFFANTSFLNRAPSLTASSVYTQRIRPVPGGYSIGTPNESGTAGLIVVATDSNQLYLLRACHQLVKLGSARLEMTPERLNDDSTIRPAR